MELIDKIVYINLEARGDRKAEFEAQMARARIAHYERFTAIASENGAIGCCLSHCQVLEQNLGAKNLLVFEDDFNFIDDLDLVREQLDLFFTSKGSEWDVCMLSANVLDADSEGEFLRINDAMTASGYIVNGAYIKTLYDTIREGAKKLADTSRHWEYMNDVYWNKLQRADRWYTFVVRLGYQRPSFSNLSDTFVDYKV